MPRCVNIDWLEVYAIEPEICAPEWFCKKGIPRECIKVRDYGTPQYRQMFTILDKKAKPFIEIRRDPYSLRTEGGIFIPHSCHLRLSNRYCYEKNPVGLILKFMRKYKYTLKSTSRLDLACDFAHFDSNQNPAKFLREYYENKYAKINQTNFHVFGKDAWDTKVFNSCKWGSEFSAITTKLYNKSMELNRDGHDKSYIRAAWQMANLPTDKDIWRVEFSLKSQVKSLVKASDILDKETGQLVTLENMIDINLHNLLSPTDWTSLFFALADHYFDFRYVEFNRNGKPQRKDRCKRVPLFRLNAIEQGYTWKRIVLNPKPGRKEKMMWNYLKEISNDRETWGYDAATSANKLRDVFFSKFASAKWQKPIDDFYLIPELKPIVKEPKMTDEQFEKWKKEQYEYMRKHIDYFIRNSEIGKKIRKEVEKNFYNKILDENLPF